MISRYIFIDKIGHCELTISPIGCHLMASVIIPQELWLYPELNSGDCVLSCWKALG